jgi:hypothetical protein
MVPKKLYKNSPERKKLSTYPIIRFLLYCFCGIIIFGLVDCASEDDDGDDDPPILKANAGEDFIVNKYSLVTLNGNQSIGAISYQWTQISGPSVTLSNASSNKATFTPLSATTYKFLLRISNDSLSDTDEIIIEIKDISSAIITQPTLNESYVSNTDNIIISGNLTGHIASIVAENKSTQTEYSGIIASDKTYTIEDIKLNQGDNEIEVIAYDSLGVEYEDKINIIYNLDIKILSDLVISPNLAFKDETTEVIVRVAISDEIEIENVILHEIRSDSSQIEVGELFDNGSISNGDDIANDGVYSAKSSIVSSSIIEKKYRAIINNTILTSIAKFVIVSHITDTEIASANQVVSDALESLPTTTINQEFNQVFDNLVFTLNSNANVSQTEISPHDNLITIQTVDGIFETIGFSFYDTSTEMRTENGPTFQNRNFSYNQRSNIKLLPLSYYATNKKPKNMFLPVFNYSNIGNLSFIGNYNVIHLEPMKFDIGKLANDKFDNYPDFTYTYIENYNVTVESFKNLIDFGIIIIHSHGGWGSIFLTGQKATNNLVKLYDDDIKAKRLVTHNHVVLVKDAGGFWKFNWDKEEETDVFAIRYPFFEHYYKQEKLSDSLVFLGMCEGLNGANFSNAFISAGAKAVVGFTDVVWSDYDRGIFDVFFEQLLQGDSVTEAVVESRQQMGDDDEKWMQDEILGGVICNLKGCNTPARFEFRGQGELKLFKEGLLNGGFEQNLKYWNSEGDIRIISVLGSLSVQEGDIMTIISTGLGAVDDSASSLIQKFKVPSDATKLNFSYNVISEEPMEWIGSSFDDKFEAVIIDSDSKSTSLASESVNNSEWTSIDSISFYGGDETTFHTGWKTIQVDISTFQNQVVTLKYSVWDNGDSMYDTAVIIDKIELQ